jgi:PhnB protein
VSRRRDVVFPLQEFAGERLGRARDPFGHLWLLGQRLADLSSDEIRNRRDAWGPKT